MNFKKTIFVVGLLILLCPFVKGQSSIHFGVNGGITLSQLSAVLTVNGEKESESDQFGNGKLGLHFGVFANIPLTDFWSIEGEAGYEQLKFEGFNAPFQDATITHLRLGLLSSYKFINWAGIIGGVELVNRTNKAEGSVGVSGLNGKKTEGLYWQGILGLRFYYEDLLSIDARATLPRISSVTRIYDGPPSNNREIVERLQAFKFTVNVPLFK